MNKQKLYITIFSVIGALSVFMPWASISSFGVSQNFSGIDGDGKITLVLFIIACVLCLIGNKQEKLQKNFIYGIWAIGAVNIIVFLVLQTNAAKASSFTARFVSAGAGHGAYVMLICAVAIILFSIDKLQLTEKADNFIASIKDKNK
ncbi:hypothetical protein J7S27_05525 [Carnobacteriaceae bacterium zg-C25]|nr:hypothetical protein J7S27_05525 [Carnobacteriaceae bacterium zg-C25]